MNDLITTTFFSILAAGFFVGIVVGLTGMGGGALMTPALIFLGVGDAATVVTADLTAAAIYKTGGAVTHAREGSPNISLAKWLIIGSVPMALLGPWMIHAAAGSEPDSLDTLLKECIGFALLFAATTYALRLYINLRRVRSGVGEADPNPPIRPVATLLVGALGGLLVGITSVGSGSVIMIALLMLYPGLSAVKLVGTDLVQAVPLVLAAAISNIARHGLDFSLTIPLILGSVPGTILGSKSDPRVPQSFIRRGVVGVLRVGATTQATQSILASFLSRYRRLHPGIEVQLTEEGGVRLLDLVEQGALHLAISAVLQGGRLQSRPLFPIRVLAVVAPRPKWKGRRTIDVLDLVNEPLLLLRREFGTRQLFDAACRIIHIQPRGVMESNEVHSLIALAEAGHGIAVVPSTVRFTSRKILMMPIVQDGKSRPFRLGRWSRSRR